MNRTAFTIAGMKESLVLAGQGLRLWTPRQALAAVIASAAVALLVGFVTVLIPNTVFVRDIPPVPWNYPVWIVTSILTGMLIATYVRPTRQARNGSDDGEQGADGREDAVGRRSARLGGAAGILAWFAVGCPVCNKIALIALGYTGALTWFAPFQPVLAIAALVLAALALVWRLRGQVSCPMPSQPRERMMVS